jgi:hypothetical protein
MIQKTYYCIIMLMRLWNACHRLPTMIIKVKVTACVSITFHFLIYLVFFLSVIIVLYLQFLLSRIQ